MQFRWTKKKKKKKTPAVSLASFPLWVSMGQFGSGNPFKTLPLCPSVFEELNVLEAFWSSCPISWLQCWTTLLPKCITKLDLLITPGRGVPKVVQCALWGHCGSLLVKTLYYKWPNPNVPDCSDQVTRPHYRSFTHLIRMNLLILHAYSVKVFTDFHSHENSFLHL